MSKTHAEWDALTEPQRWTILFRAFGKDKPTSLLSQLKWVELTLTERNTLYSFDWPAIEGPKN